MSDLLSEINRVREIMGILKEQDIDEKVIKPSEEITEWAKGQIEMLQRRVDAGPTDIWDEQDILDAKEEIIRLQQDPIAEAIEDKERYCRWVDEGDNDWIGQCQEMTDLLATLSSEEETDVKAERKELSRVTNTDGTITVTYDDKSTEILPAKKVKKNKNKTKEKKNKTKEKKEKEKTWKGKWRGKSEKKAEAEKRVDDLQDELYTAWKDEITTTLDRIGEKDIFGTQQAYATKDKFKAVEHILTKMIRINAILAKTVIIIQNKKYLESKTLATANFGENPTATITNTGDLEWAFENEFESLVERIEKNRKIIDKKFGLLWDVFKGKSGLGKDIDAKLKPIKNELESAVQTLYALEPYIKEHTYVNSKNETHTVNYIDDVLSTAGQLKDAHKKYASGELQ